jgi:hypothetical protein
MIDLSKQDKPYEEIKRDREVLIDWIEQSELDKAKMISKYEGLISDLEIKVEELESPKFTKMDAAEAEEMMISNVKQPVTEAYGENPFWDKVEENVKKLDYEAELVDIMNSLNEQDPEVAHGRADEILMEALNYLGYDTLVAAYNDLVGRATWWACA